MGQHHSEIGSGALILLSTVLFVMYWFLAKSEIIKQKFFTKYTFDEAARKHIFFTKYLGFFLLGIVPLIFAMCILGKDLKSMGLWFNGNTTVFSIIWIVVLAIIIIPLTYYAAKRPSNLLNYPQIRAKIWTRKTFFINLLGWSIYLFGYELFFRGVFLFTLVDELGIPFAISVNVMFYTLSHIPKGLGETLGALPFGLLLCFLTIQSATIWIAYFSHLILAFTNCLTALAYHKEIYFQGWTKKRLNG